MIDPSALRALILQQTAGSAVGLAWAAGNDVQCAAALNDASDPHMTMTRPRVISMSGLFGLVGNGVSQAAFVAIFNHPTIAKLIDDVNSQNRSGVVLWSQAYMVAGMISQSEQQAIAGYVTAQDTVQTSLAQQRFATDVAPSDVQAARGAK